jgi:hydrogenase expression/formation protein HypC
MIMALAIIHFQYPLEVNMCLAIPGKVIELYETNGMKMARVDFGGVIKEACMEYLPEVKLGDYTIIHVGFGLSILDEKEALETMELLKQIEEMGDDGIAA